MTDMVAAVVVPTIIIPVIPQYIDNDPDIKAVIANNSTIGTFCCFVTRPSVSLPGTISGVATVLVVDCADVPDVPTSTSTTFLLSSSNFE